MSNAVTSRETAKGLFGPRLRLDEKLAASAQNAVWLATDIRTGARHSVEILPFSGPNESPTWTRSNGSLIPPAHPSLLAFYRFETTSAGTAVVSAFDPALRQLPVGRSPIKAVDATLALSWIEELAHAVHELHDAGLRAHGAIIPSRLFLPSSRPPLLTGYPHAAYQNSGDDLAFLPAERARGDAPTRGHDVFGLAALAYFFLSGGATPPNPAEPLESGIDGARQRRGLAPTGWTAGWDRPILDALVAPADARPSNIKSWYNEIARALGRPTLRTALQTRQVPAPSGDDRPRRTPPWRRHSVDRAAASPGKNDPSSPLRLMEQIREQSAELEAQKEDLRQHRIELEARSAELSRTKQELSELSKQLTQDRAELDRRTSSVTESQRSVEALQNELHQKLAQQAKAQNEWRTEAQRELSKRADELDAQSKALAELQQKLIALTGGNSPAEWQAFVRRIEKSVTENASLALRLETEKKQLDEQRRQLEQRSAHSSASPSTPVVKDAVEPPPPPPVIAATDKPAETASNTNPPVSHERPAPPVSTENRRSTILTPTGRHLHLFAGSIVRFGRHANSDMLLVAILNGQAQPAMSLNREISRKHFELQVTANEVRVIDGWSDDGKASAHGLCVEGRRVPPGGSPLKSGMLISVTARAPGRSVPHWQIRLIQSSPSSPISGVLMRRMDEAPDDVGVVLDEVAVRDLGLSDTDSADPSVVADSGNLFWKTGQTLTPFAVGPGPLQSLSVLSVGFCSPSIVAPST